MSEKTKIAVLGGGVGSLTAVFELTRDPDWKSRYDITVYQMGWRLGGKGASGRNAAVHQRIEEHGLHIWFGFYENAFRVIREVYDELARPDGAPLAKWTDAFQKQDLVVLMDKHRDVWKRWDLTFPENDGVPGSGGELPTAWDYVQMMLGWMKEIFEQSDHFDVARDHPTIVQRILRELPRVRTFLERVLHLGEITSEATFLHIAHAIATAMPDDVGEHDTHHHETIRWLLGRFVDWLEKRLGGELARNDDARHLFILLDLIAANVRGMIEDRLLFTPYDFTSIDDEDYQAWLLRHGARKITVYSAPVTSLYDLVFAVDQGFAAGTVLHGALRMLFTYKGAVIWKMQAGMGDAIFAPFYEVLRRRGVKIEFFHKVEALRLSADKNLVAAIELTRQVSIVGGKEYEPLVDVKGLPCWPNEPRWEQIVEKAAKTHDLESFWDDWQGVEKKKLEVGRDFDIVLLGIPVGAHPHIARELMDASPAFRASATNVKTTRTQAMQIWVSKSLPELGWTGPSPVMGAYEEPFDTWADMSHLIAREDWPADAIGSLAYFCSPYRGPENAPPAPDLTYPKTMTAIAKANAIAWLDAHAPAIWPGARAGDGFDFSILVDDAGRAGKARFDAQYWRLDINPTDRYVLSVPKSTASRLRADQSGFDNVFLAGDWLRTGINAGCVEAAVMGGLQASRAIGGRPERIVGDESMPSRGRARRVPTSASRELPFYVDRGGDLEVRQPYDLLRSRLYAFAVAADLDALQRTLDKYLNRHGGQTTVYKPLAPLTMVVAAAIAQIRSLDACDSQKGWLSERDVGLWIPVMAGKEIDGVFVAERLLWFIPYIFVDSGIAMAAGREIYGFPKEMAKLVYPGDPGDAARFEVDTTVIPVYAPTSEAVQQNVVKVWRTPEGPLGTLASTWSNVEGATKGLATAVIELAEKGTIVVPGLELLRTLVRDVAQVETGLVFFKQFRDVTDASRACYQAVVEAAAEVHTIAGGGFLSGDWRVEIRSWASHPIAADLGLANGTLVPLLATWLECDFAVGLGRTIWSTP